MISALGGIGAAAGPLIGGVITTAISWRAAFIFQVLVIALILILSREPDRPAATRPQLAHFDGLGAALSATGLVLVVLGILAADNNLWLTAALITAGVVVLLLFFVSVRAKEKCRPGAAAVHRHCSATGPPTSAWSRRTCSGSCSSARPS